ncbi:MAG: DUF721 domain-containing protein [Treponema sp.]|nr:DUF721 domain-containing protein [Treponema sp.]
MKTAGDIFSVLFDEGFVKKAKGYSKLFDSWADITAKNGIAAAAAHSKIKDLDRGILLIEMDHPGWKQIIHSKQSKLLNDFRYRFPDMDISGISLILGKSEPEAEEKTKEFTQRQEDTNNIKNTEREIISEPIKQGLESIKDEDFKETLKKLGETISNREKR